MGERHEKPWFVVWQPETGAPTVRHESAQIAADEAKRLARLNPGKKFHVLALYGTAVVDNLQWQVVAPHPYDDDIPF